MPEGCLEIASNAYKSLSTFLQTLLRCSSHFDAHFPQDMTTTSAKSTLGNIQDVRILNPFRLWGTRTNGEFSLKRARGVQVWRQQNIYSLGSSSMQLFFCCPWDAEDITIACRNYRTFLFCSVRIKISMKRGAFEYSHFVSLKFYAPLFKHLSSFTFPSSWP